MPALIQYTAVPTFRDSQGKFTKANSQLLNFRRDEMREQGRKLVEITRGEVRGGPSGTIAKQIRYQTFISGDAVGFRTLTGQIARWHQTGTGIYGPRGQLIRPISAKALRWLAGGGIIFRMWSRGVKPDDFYGRALDKWKPEGQKALNRIATRWLEVVRSG